MGWQLSSDWWLSMLQSRWVPAWHAEHGRQRLFVQQVPYHPASPLRGFALQERFLVESKLRRELHNQLQDLQGAIRVYCRRALHWGRWGLDSSNLPLLTGHTEACPQGAPTVGEGGGGWPQRGVQVRPAERQRGGGRRQASGYFLPELDSAGRAACSVPTAGCCMGWHKQ